jgi:hypothetical protein
MLVDSLVDSATGRSSGEDVLQEDRTDIWETFTRVSFVIALDIA